MRSLPCSTAPFPYCYYPIASQRIALNSITDIADSHPFHKFNLPDLIQYWLSQPTIAAVNKKSCYLWHLPGRCYCHASCNLLAIIMTVASNVYYIVRKLSIIQLWRKNKNPKRYYAINYLLTIYNFFLFLWQ